jgi:PKD repeat protein
MSGNVATWAWTFGDGQTSAVQNPDPVTYNVSTVTTFTITLVVTSTDGATTSAGVRVCPGVTTAYCHHTYT